MAVHRRAKRYSAWILSAILWSALAGCNDSTATRHYECERFGYSFDYSSRLRIALPWEVPTGTAGHLESSVVLVLPPNAAGSVRESIVVGTTPAAERTSDFRLVRILWWIRQIRSVKSRLDAISEASAFPVVAGGLDGMGVEYAGTLSDERMRAASIVLPSAEVDVVVLITASEAEWPAVWRLAAAIIRSFRFAGASSLATPLPHPKKSRSLQLPGVDAVVRYPSRLVALPDKLQLQSPSPFRRATLVYRQDLVDSGEAEDAVGRSQGSVALSPLDSISVQVYETALPESPTTLGAWRSLGVSRTQRRDWLQRVNEAAPSSQMRTVLFRRYSVRQLTGCHWVVQYQVCGDSVIHAWFLLVRRSHLVVFEINCASRRWEGKRALFQSVVESTALR